MFSPVPCRYFLNLQAIIAERVEEKPKNDIHLPVPSGLSGKAPAGSMDI